MVVPHWASPEFPDTTSGTPTQGHSSFRPLRIATRVLQPNAGTPALHGHDSALSQFQFALGNGACTNSRLFAIANIDKPDDPGMSGAKRDREPAEILVERHQHLPGARRMGKDFVVPRIGRPVADPIHPMPGALEFRPGTRPDATVEQELQAASLVMAGSTRSWPTTRRA